MTSELAKTISTCSIWLAMAVIFTFGLFKMNGDAFFFIVATVILAGAAGWRHGAGLAEGSIQRSTGRGSPG